MLFSLPRKRGINIAKIRGNKVTDYTLVVLRGRVMEEYYDSEGVCVATYELAAGDLCGYCDFVIKSNDKVV